MASEIARAIGRVYSSAQLNPAVVGSRVKLVDGDPSTQLTVTGVSANLTSLQFDQVSQEDSPAEVANEIVLALDRVYNFPTDLNPIRIGHRINLVDGNADGNPTTLLAITASANLVGLGFVEGTPNTDFNGSNIIVPVNAGMDRDTVAAQIQQRFADIASAPTVSENDTDPLNDSRTNAQNLDAQTWTRSFRQDVTNPLTVQHLTVNAAGDGSRTRLFAVRDN